VVTIIITRPDTDRGLHAHAMGTIILSHHTDRSHAPAWECLPGRSASGLESEGRALQLHAYPEQYPRLWHAPKYSPHSI